MIINSERSPIVSLYYIGSRIIKVLHENDSQSIDMLFNLVQESIGQKVHIDFFYYALDWLYILDTIRMENGEVQLCV